MLLSLFGAGLRVGHRRRRRHGVASTVEQDVGEAVGRVSQDHGLGHDLEDRVVTPDPGGQAGVVDVCDVVALGRLCPVVVDHGKQLVLALLDGQVLDYFLFC